MIVFYAADMHGSELVWRKFVNAAKFYGAEVLILGGDITGKLLIPLVEEKPGRYVAEVFGKRETVKRQDDLEELEKRLRFNGFYPFRCTPQKYQTMAGSKEECMLVMRELMVETVRRWVSIADEKLSGTEISIYGIAGNDDDFIVDEALNGEHVKNVEGKVVAMGEYQLLSSAWGNISPWDTPREKNEDDLFEMFEQIAAQLQPGRPTVFNLHIPPFNSGLDTGPLIVGLDEEGNAIVQKVSGSMVEAPVGSHAVRRLLEEIQPIISFHSHIHESRNVKKIGRTLCLNPGSNYQNGSLEGALVELKGDTVVRYQFVSG